jgi:hypothetical protein
MMIIVSLQIVLPLHQDHLQFQTHLCQIIITEIMVLLLIYFLIQQQHLILIIIYHHTFIQHHHKQHIIQQTQYPIQIYFQPSSNIYPTDPSSSSSIITASNSFQNILQQFQQKY